MPTLPRQTDYRTHPQFLQSSQARPDSCGDNRAFQELATIFEEKVHPTEGRGISICIRMCNPIMVWTEKLLVCGYSEEELTGWVRPLGIFNQSP
ncbi:hypothetical protein PoB_000481000 [Plakobranchus ocellatus]|uniref:Uncharacterized protein n=1 Tax=Plakobranchus ocellatus TaxID=259542 RepID=A0AAV3Y5E0_9GAST|nr:hypothetical protein PoB_000481000 [Plakobranchus ocellatus]